MSSLTSKAVVSSVKIGNREIEGLMLPDGSFAVAASQLSELGFVNQAHASRDLLSLLGKESSLTKVKSELNSKPINCITLDQLTEVIKQGVIKDIKIAKELATELIGLSLQQLFCDSFDVKFEAEDRQQWLKARQQGKEKRRTLTDAIQDYIFRNEPSDNYRNFIYTNVSDCLNRAVFGKTSKKLKEEKGLKTNDLLRDSFTDKELIVINDLETFALKLIDRRNIEPLQAIKDAIALYLD